MGGDGDRSAISRLVDYLGWNPALLAAIVASLGSIAQGNGMTEGAPSWVDLIINIYHGLRETVAGMVLPIDAPDWQKDAAVAGLGVVALLARWFVGFFWSIGAFLLIAIGGYFALQYLSAG